MRFRILGPFEAYDSDGAPVRLHAPKQRALLTVLLLHANESLSIGRIESALWPGQPPPSAPGVVRTYMSGLRHTLRLDDKGSLPRLTKEPAGYRLVLAAADLDLAVFDDLSSRGHDAFHRGDKTQAARLLSAALALWRGEPAADIVLDTYTSAIIAGLDERRLVAEETWADAQLALGGGADLVGRLRRLAADQPLRERIRSQLMLALSRAGRKAEALEEFRALRGRMIDELGVEPSATVQKLHQRILINDPALVVAPAQSLVPRQLPRDTSHFTGRDTELAAIEATLSPVDVTSPSIAMVTGTAGSGKTALALHFAHLVADRFPDGQLFVDLRGHAAAEPVPAAEALGRFLHALGATDVPGGTDEAAAMYRSLLSGKRVLILLDNAANASQVRPLLPGSPGCLVLVTSRSTLHGLVARDGGIPVAVGPLEQSESVALLRKILGGRRLDTEPGTAAAIAARCACLPLALRVAAERAVHRPQLTLAAMAAELEDERRTLDVLTTGEDDSTIRSVFSWSYRRLAPATARMFRLLGLHPGAEVSIPAAAALAGETISMTALALDQLASTHLAEEIATGRYRCHDLLRAYAFELAADIDPAIDRAAATRNVLTWYLHTADAASRRIGGTRRRIALDPLGPVLPLAFLGYDDALAWCDMEQANLVAAVQRAATEAGLEAIAWQILAAASDFFRLHRPWAEWIACNEAGLAAARRAEDTQGQAWTLNELGRVYFELARYAEATACYEEALRLVRQTGDEHDEGTVLNNLASLYGETSRTVDALDYFLQGLDLARRTGNRFGEAVALGNVGEIHRRTGHARHAIICHREAMDIAIEIGDRQGQALALHNLGEAFEALRRPDTSREYYLRALKVYDETSDRHGKARTLRTLGDLLYSAGRTVDAREHWNQVLEILEDLGDRRAEEVRSLLRATFGDGNDSDSQCW